MWVKFKPVKKKEILDRVVRGLPERTRILPASDGWVLSLWVGKKGRLLD